MLKLHVWGRELDVPESHRCRRTGRSCKALKARWPFPLPSRSSAPTDRRGRRQSPVDANAPLNGNAQKLQYISWPNTLMSLFIHSFLQ
eukprot:scaffold24383_cov36-Prasinocladus_malaysianus.AAC.1